MSHDEQACVRHALGRRNSAITSGRSLQPPKPKQCRKLHAVRFLPVRLTMRWLHVISKRHTHRCTCFVVMVPTASCDDRQIFAHRSPTALPIDRPTDAMRRRPPPNSRSSFPLSATHRGMSSRRSFVRSRVHPPPARAVEVPTKQPAAQRSKDQSRRFPAVVGTSILRTYGARRMRWLVEEVCILNSAAADSVRLTSLRFIELLRI